MGSNRTGRKRSSKASAMVGATPMSDGLTDLIHGKGLAAAGRDLDRGKDPKELSKVSVGNFFTAVPRTAVLNDDENAPDTFKHNDAAPPGLGEISGGEQRRRQQQGRSCCQHAASMLDRQQSVLMLDCIASTG